MAVSVDNEGGGRRKRVDADLNLVPYIDLLTCMIAFLLITAVWTQLARLEVLQRGQGDRGLDNQPQAQIAVLVHADGFALLVDKQQHPLPLLKGELDYGALGSELKKLKEAHPDKADIEVLSEDAIQFDALVKTMDAAMGAGFPAISLLDAARAAL